MIDLSSFMVGSPRHHWRRAEAGLLDSPDARRGSRLKTNERGSPLEEVKMRKNEYRVFLGKAESKWLDKLVEEGDLGRTPSEVVRTIFRDVRRGLIK